MKLKDVLKQYRVKHLVQNNQIYRQVTISQTGDVSFRGENEGSKIGRKRQFILDLKKHPNTLIFIRQGVFKGGIGIAPKEVDGCIVTENMPMFDIVNVEPEYLRYYTLSPQFKRAVDTIVPLGTAQKAIHERQLLEIDFPETAAKKQNAIIEKLKSIDKKQKELESDVSSQLNFIQKLRQSILQEAVQGKLVPQNPKDEPASELLKKIKADKEKKIRKDNDLPLISKEEIPYDLPRGWVFARLGEIFVLVYGDGLKKEYTIPDGKYPVYGSNGIVGYYNEYLTEKRSIIIGRKGSSGALNISELPSWTTDVAYYVEELKNVDFKFMYYLLKSLKLESMGKGIKPGLNRNEAYNRVFGLPPLSEQKRIVEKVDQLMNLCDELELKIQENQKNSELLMQAVLKEAFENET